MDQDKFVEHIHPCKYVSRKTDTFTQKTEQPDEIRSTNNEGI